MKKYIVALVACFCSLSSAYSIAPSRHIVHYHYEPPKGIRLELPQYPLDNNQEYHTQPQPQPQQQQQQYRYQQQPHQHHHHHLHHHHQQQQQQQQHQIYQQQQQNYHQTQQQQSYQQQRNYQGQYPRQENVPLTMTLNSQGYNSPTEALTDNEESDSVRLPLPLGVPSINVGPLPLSKGVTYSERPNLTSYGTPYPQKKVR